jgi:hypothetical protein
MSSAALSTIVKQQSQTMPYFYTPCIDCALHSTLYRLLLMTVDKVLYNHGAKASRMAKQDSNQPCIQPCIQPHAQHMHLRCPSLCAPTVISLYTGLFCACFRRIFAKLPFADTLSLGFLVSSSRSLEPAQPAFSRSRIPEGRFCTRVRPPAYA